MSFQSLPGRAAIAFGGYLLKNPGELLRAAKNAAAFKVGVPVDALLWIARELGGDKVPSDLALSARAPGLFAAASFEMMDTPLRGSANIIIERVEVRSDAILVDVRLEDISLVVTRTGVGTPVAALLQSGALDLTRPGDLISYMPKRPAFLVGSQGNVLTFDLMRHPKLSAERARHIVGLLAPFVGINAIETEGKHIDVAFDPIPRGAQELILNLKKLF